MLTVRTCVVGCTGVVCISDLELYLKLYVAYSSINLLTSVCVCVCQWLYILIGFVVFTFVNSTAAGAAGGGGGGGQ